jgi:hypothetical protein
MVSLEFFLHALRSLGVGFYYLDLIVYLKLIWIVDVIVNNYIFDVHFFIFMLILPFPYLFQHASVFRAHLFHLFLGGILNFLEIYRHVFLDSVLFPIWRPCDHLSTELILIAQDLSVWWLLFLENIFNCELLIDLT